MSPTNKTIKFLDILRWIAAIIILPNVLWVIFISINLPFEWLLLKTIRFSFSVHLILWFFLGIPIMTVCLGLGHIPATISIFIVRQKKTYGKILAICNTLLFILMLLTVWLDFVRFSWEALPYKTTNKIIFTIVSSLMLKFSSVFLDLD